MCTFVVSPPYNVCHNVVDADGVTCFGTNLLLSPTTSKPTVNQAEPILNRCQLEHERVRYSELLHLDVCMLLLRPLNAIRPTFSRHLTRYPSYRPMTRVQIPENMEIHLNDSENEICALLDGCTKWMKTERGVDTSCRIAGGWVRDKVSSKPITYPSLRRADLRVLRS